MLYITCYWISMLVFISGIVVTLLSRYRVRNVRFKSLNILIVSVFISASTLFIPIYSRIFQGDSLSWIKTFLISIHNAIRLFIVDGEFDIIDNNITGNVGGIAAPYTILAAVIFVLAPLLTFSAALSLIKNAHAYISYFFSYFRDIYVFSELNDESIVLAESVIEKDPRARIIYTDVFEKNEEISYELVQKAREMRSILFKKDIGLVNYWRHSRKNMIAFFAIGYDETENIRQAMSLINEFRNRENTELYVFTTKREGELLLADMDKGKVKVRRINGCRSLINEYLYEYGKKYIFDSAISSRGRDKNIHILIAGLGGYGKEMLKALTWFCQMEGYHVYIDAFDKDKSAEDRIAAECPELLSKKYNGKRIKGEAEYNINIHSGVDIYTGTFDKKVKNINCPTFIFIALGDDSENVNASVRLRILMLQKFNEKPHITTVVKNSVISSRLENVKHYKGEKYKIQFIGALNKMYSIDSVKTTDLEKKALGIHMNGEWYQGNEEDDTSHGAEKNKQKKKEFSEYEYYYNSSISTAIHNELKKNILDIIDDQGRLKPDKEELVAELEHRRWNAYMRTEGFIYSPYRNDLGKMHNDLKSYDELSEEEIPKDRAAVAGSCEKQ